MPKKKAKAKASTDAESATGGSPSGEVPVVDEAALRRLIREDELREEAARRPTTSEGTARYAYEAGDTVHGRVDATRLQQEEELRDIIQKARYNPWHFFHHGLLHRKDQSGNKMYAPYGDALVKTTPFSSLPTDMRKLLGSEYNWTSWCCHPLSGYGVHFFLKGFELGKMQGNMLLELSYKAKAYTDGYKSPFDQGQGNDPSTILTDLSMLSTVSSPRSSPRLASKILRTQIPGQRSRSPTTPTMPSSSLCTMLSVWKGMCGLSLRRFGRIFHGRRSGLPGLRARLLWIHSKALGESRHQASIQNQHPRRLYSV